MTEPEPRPEIDGAAYFALAADITRILQPKLMKRDRLTAQENTKLDKVRAKARRIIAEIPAIRRCVERPIGANPEPLATPFLTASSPSAHFVVDGSGIRSTGPLVEAPNGKSAGVERSYMQQAKEDRNTLSLRWRLTESWSTDTLRLEVLARNYEASHLYSQLGQERYEIGQLQAQNELLKQRNAELVAGQGKWQNEDDQKSPPVDEPLDKDARIAGGGVDALLAHHGVPPEKQPLVASRGWSSNPDTTYHLTQPTQPTVGKQVIYTSRGSADGRYEPARRAAIITEVPDLLPEQPNSGPEDYVKSVHLCVLNPTGLFFDQNVPFAPEPAAGHWSWS